MVARPLSSARGKITYPPNRTRGLRGGALVKSGPVIIINGQVSRRTLQVNQCRKQLHLLPLAFRAVPIVYSFFILNIVISKLSSALKTLHKLAVFPSFLRMIHKAIIACYHGVSLDFSMPLFMQHPWPFAGVLPGCSQGIPYKNFFTPPIFPLFEVDFGGCEFQPAVHFGHSPLSDNRSGALAKVTVELLADAVLIQNIKDFLPVF